MSVRRAIRLGRRIDYEMAPWPIAEVSNPAASLA
jgi:hypothetical protein